jgi:hypothetical protein
MSARRIQTVFINSANRLNGSIYDFQVSLNDGVVKAQDLNTELRISVIHLCINRSYYTVEAETTWTLLNVTQNTNVIYTIPPGYYDVFSFKVYLLSILVNWTIIYLKSTNTYVFTPPADGNQYQFQFMNSSGCLFGFDDDITTVSFSNSTPISSSKPILMTLENSLFLRTDIPRKAFCAIDNLSSSTFNESDILCALPISGNEFPFKNIALSDSNQFSFTMGARELNIFRLYITDQNGTSVPLRYDFVIALKIEYMMVEEVDESLEVLMEIRNLLKYVTLDKFLNV